MIKQITIVGILALALILVTAAVYAQSAYAGFGFGRGFGGGQGVIGGTSGPPGPYCATLGQNNPNC